MPIVPFSSGDVAAVLRANGRPGIFPIGLGLDPDVEAWRDAILASGNTVSNATVRLVNSFTLRLKAASLWNKCYMIDPCVGGSLVASLYRLKVPSGVARNASTGGFNNSDYNERGASGGRTGNGSTKYIDTLINPSALGFSVSSFMLWAYTRTAATAGTSRVTFGVRTAAGSNEIQGGWFFIGTVETVGVANTGGAEYPAGSSSSQIGLLGGGTSGSRTQQYYRNGVAVGASAVASSGMPNFNIYAHVLNSGGTGLAYCNRAISSMIFTQGLSLVEIATLNSIVQAFETALGRNV